MAEAEPDGADEATLQMPEREAVGTASEAFSGVEDERLFGELRARLFARGEPMRVGRYRVLRRLGAGAMGEVQLAVDDELERPVAIKFVHPHLASARAARGLRREARALARLAHPNVVRVYEVGTHHGRVYLAMEYIEGASLREWLRAESPGPRQILAAYLDAARGLAAAHGAGVIHRDLKPDNVLRGLDGRVAVADFGLAALDRGEDSVDDPPGGTRTSDESSAESSAEPGSETGPADHSQALSRTGEIKGTPAYMPPEQFQGRSDARSDQFSLCVALYEGLYGKRPFHRRTIDEVRGGAVDWTPRPPPKRGAAPAWVWPILRRGLAEDPEQRWPSVDELIAALEAGLSKRRRRARVLGSGLVALAVGLASGLGVALFGAGEPVDDCVALDGELADVWDPSRRAELVETFSSVAARTRRPWLERSGTLVADGLDQWRARWLESRGELCRARAGGDPVVLARHGACLERRRRTVAAIVELLLAGEPGALHEAPRAVQGLADPRACAREALAGGPPEAPEAIADRVEALRGELAQVDAELSTARYEDALARTGRVLAAARSLDYAPLLAEASLARGRALMRAERFEAALEQLERAADLGEVSRHDRVVARSWELMARAVATRRPDLDRGRRWLRRAEAAGGRVGLDELGEARLIQLRGKLALLAGDPEEALARFEEAREVFEAHGDLIESADANSGIGRALLERGEGPRAELAFEEALAQLEQIHGPGHPEVATAASNLGQVALGLEHAELGRGLLRRALAIWSETGEERPRDAGRAHFALAQLELDAGEFTVAVEHARAAAAAFDVDLEAGDPLHAEVAGLLATGAYFLGQAEESVAAWRRALDGYAALHGADDLYTGLFRVGLGWALLAAGERAEARAAFEAGRDTIEAQLGAGTQDSADARLGLVAVELSEGALDQARARLEAFGGPPTGELDRPVYELFFALTALRADPDDDDARARLRGAAALASAVAGGEAMFEVLLDSVGAGPDARRLIAR